MKTFSYLIFRISWIYDNRKERYVNRPMLITEKAVICMIACVLIPSHTPFWIYRDISALEVIARGMTHDISLDEFGYGKSHRGFLAYASD